MENQKLLPIRADILEVKRFIFKQKMADKRRVKDYEIDFYLSGNRTITLDDETFPVREGTLLFRKPGQYIIGKGDYDVYVLSLNFDEGMKIPPEEYRRDRSTPPQKEFAHPLLNNIPTYFSPYRKHDYMRIFEQLCLYSYPAVENKKQQQILLNELLLLINADIFHDRLLERDEINPIIKSSCKYINSNFSKNITLSGLAEKAHLSQNYFLKLFKKEMGVTPKEYIIQIRLEHARALLSGTKLKINVIAAECGFNDTSYFSLFFKRKFGKTPIEYRESN